MHQKQSAMISSPINCHIGQSSARPTKKQYIISYNKMKNFIFKVLIKIFVPQVIVAYNSNIYHKMVNKLWYREGNNHGEPSFMPTEYSKIIIACPVV